MHYLKPMMPSLRDILCFVFNVSALRQACKLHLFSRAFLAGLALWGVSVGVILLHAFRPFPLPALWLTAIEIFSVFAGCCWVALPVFVCLNIRMHLQLRKPLHVGQAVQFIIGVSLWRQALRGRLPVQFWGAGVVGAWLAFLILNWPMSFAWQILLMLAFVVNILFFIIIPLLFVLGKWSEREVQRDLPPHRKRRAAYGDL